MFRLRGSGPSLREIGGNVYSSKLPGGNLILAVLDRTLMGWSDRGGASRHFGDCWSALVSGHLQAQIGATRTQPAGVSYRLEAVVRLDDDPRIAIQAGRHKLTNPDFVLFGRAPDGSPVLQAADSKFAVDTIKPAQVSSEALQALLDVEQGLVRNALEQDVHNHDVATATVVNGIFVSPIGPLTDFFLPRVISDPRTGVERSQVELVPVDPLELFGDLDAAGLIGRLALVDRLPVSPRDHLLAAMYYLRVSCACAWMWVEERTPLLSLQDPPAIDFAEVATQIDRRAGKATSAFALLEVWFQSVEEISRDRKTLSDIVSLPLRMSEIRRAVESAGLGDDRKVVRVVRAALDRRYRHRLLDIVGEIPPIPLEPLPRILERVAEASRSLRPEMMELGARLIGEHAAQARESGSATERRG